MELSRQQQTALALTLLPVVFVLLVNGFYMAALANRSVPFFWLVDACQWILLPAIVLFWLARRAALLPKHYGYAWPIDQWRSLSWKTLWVFVTAYLAFSTDKIFWYLLRPSGNHFSWPEIFPDGPLRVFVWLYSSASAGLIESAFFISLPWLLYQSVFKQPNKNRFALLVSIVFALAHWEQGAHVVLGSFCFNFVMCAWFFELKTLWPIAFAHMGVDLIALA